MKGKTSPSGLSAFRRKSWVRGSCTTRRPSQDDRCLIQAPDDNHPFLNSVRSFMAMVPPDNSDSCRWQKPLGLCFPLSQTRRTYHGDHQSPTRILLDYLDADNALSYLPRGPACSNTRLLFILLLKASVYEAKEGWGLARPCTGGHYHEFRASFRSKFLGHLVIVLMFTEWSWLCPWASTGPVSKEFKNRRASLVSHLRIIIMYCSNSYVVSGWVHREENYSWLPLMQKAFGANNLHFYNAVEFKCYYIHGPYYQI